MRIVKMFDAIEIHREIGIEVLRICYTDFCNDVAIPWWIEEDEENENYKKN